MAIQISTNQPHSPLPIRDINSLVKELTDSAENNGISGRSNSDVVVLGQNGSKDAILAVEPTKRPANTPRGLESDRK